MIDQDARDFRGSPDRFGYEWGAYAEILPEYEEQFRRWTVHVAPGDWRDKSFLDVGCGMGRNSYWPMIYGARAAALPISTSVRSRAPGAISRVSLQTTSCTRVPMIFPLSIGSTFPSLSASFTTWNIRGAPCSGWHAPSNREVRC
jgi:hypothetical protein